MAQVLLDVDRLLDEVAADVGTDDYGDPSFREGLELLVESASTEAELHDVGRAVLDTQCRQALANRLRVIDWHRRHPELADQPVPAPIFIVGASRTGTTALSHLLAADPANRSLLGWEATSSVPPPTAAAYWDDPRYVAARDAPDMLAALNPGFRAIHHDPPDAPIECVPVLAQHFTSAQFPTMFNIAAYHEWLLRIDHTPAYRYHRQVLQVLQSAHPGRWQLKSPHHAMAIDALTRVYPDARFVVTHRDPVKSLASTCSLVLSLTGTFSDADWRDHIARTWPATVAAMVDRVLDHRERHPETPVHDVRYHDLVADPVGTVAAIYDHFGITLTADAERAMRAQAEREPQHKYGTHRYSLADVGLRRDDVEPLFARYLATVDVPREDA